ncbi:MAG: hypothetical protein V5A62_00570 [Haloarculaceae archaeon]
MEDDGRTDNTDTEPIRAADYRDVVRVSEPDLSPDGTHVASVRPTPDGDEEYGSTVWVAPTDPTEGEPRRFTAVEGRDFEPRYSPDGGRIAFRSIRGDDERAQLWVLPTDGGEARRVTEVLGGVESFEWCPDGERIAFVQRGTRTRRGRGVVLPRWKRVVLSLPLGAYDRRYARVRPLRCPPRDRDRRDVIPDGGPHGPRRAGPL